MKPLNRIILFLTMALKGFSQNSSSEIIQDNMLWVGYYNTINFHDKWSLNSDSQFRTKNGVKNNSQALIRMGMSKEEIKFEKDFILYKSIQSFDPNQKTKFSTWFCNCVRYHFLNYLNYNKKYFLNVGFGVDIFTNKDILFTTDKNTEMYDYLSSLLSSFKDPRINEVYKLRYFSNSSKTATWNTIAKKLNISTQTAINLHEKARLFLKNKIVSKNSFDFV